MLLEVLLEVCSSAVVFADRDQRQLAVLMPTLCLSWPTLRVLVRIGIQKSMSHLGKDSQVSEYAAEGRTWSLSCL